MKYTVGLEEILTEVREHCAAMNYGKLTVEFTFHEGEVAKYRVSKETPLQRPQERKSGPGG